MREGTAALPPFSPSNYPIQTPQSNLNPSSTPACSRTRTSLTRFPIAFFYSRFVDDSFGFALTWNYWFNDAVSTAADLVALQLLLKYWTDNFPGWALSLIFWFVLIITNIISVRAYGEVKKNPHLQLECATLLYMMEADIARPMFSLNIGSACSKLLLLL